MNVTNLKRKIFEFQKEEQKSLRHRKRHSNTKKNYDIKNTKKNDFFQTSKSPNNKLYNTNSFSFNKEGCPNNVIKNQNLAYIKTHSGNENNSDNNYLSISHKIKNNLNINNII
jgi:hypothetical protein